MKQNEFLNATRFRTQKEAVAWLRGQGWEISEPSFSRHKKEGRISTDAEGWFTVDGLRAFASAALARTAVVEDAQSRAAALEKMNADSELKSVKAARERLKLEREQGSLMPRAEHEAGLAARAVFFRSEIESFIFRKGGELIEVTGGKEENFQELIAWWRRETADWMDAWAQDREFLQEEDAASDVLEAEDGEGGAAAQSPGAADGTEFDGGDGE